MLEERTRIARELHDVVAHHMSLIAVRAETAPYRPSGLPAPVSDEFRSLSEAAREAMADMRRLLGVLRNDQPAKREPQPQLSDLPALIGAARLAGVSVELSVPIRNSVPVGASPSACARTGSCRNHCPMRASMLRARRSRYRSTMAAAPYYCEWRTDRAGHPRPGR